MTPRFESERPFSQSPVLDYLDKIRREMIEPERDIILAVSTLYEKVTDEDISDELLRELVFDKKTGQTVTREQMVTYPIVVFGEAMEQTMETGRVAVEYKRALQGVLSICQDRHDESCAEGPCVSYLDTRLDQELFCPVMECVDFLAYGIICNNFADTGYLVDAVRQRQQVELRAQALISSSPKFATVYHRYLEFYQDKMNDFSGDENLSG